VNTRGQYGSAPQGRVSVGSFLVHTLELKQRYNNVHTGAAQALLTDLTKEGHATLAGTNRWEIALKEGAWVLFTWHPDSSALEVTVTDRELRPVDQLASTRRRYETILNRITPRLKSFGATTVGAAIVGQGSIVPHTPGEIEDELDQLHGEIMQFGQEVAEKLRNPEYARASADSETQRLRAEEDAAYAYESSLPTPPPPSEWMKHPQDILRFKREYDTQIAAAKKAKAASQARADHEQRVLGTQASPTLAWAQSTWDPFFRSWNKWRGEKKDIPLQLWPGSGAWDRIQDYRAQYIDIRNNAPFKATGPAPVSPEGRRDPSLTGGLEDILKIGKYALIGALGIGAVVALSSVASNLRSGKDPGEKYMDLIRERRSRAPRALPPPRRAQLALPPGEDV